MWYLALDPYAKQTQISRNACNLNYKPYPQYSKFNTPIILNISATNLDDFVKLTKKISKDSNSHFIS